MINADGGAEESVIARTRSGWKNFRDLLPVLTCRGFSFRWKERVYKACVRSVMLYGSKSAMIWE